MLKCMELEWGTTDVFQKLTDVELFEGQTTLWFFPGERTAPLGVDAAP